MMMGVGEDDGINKTGRALGLWNVLRAVVGAPLALSFVVVIVMCVRKRTCMTDMGHAH